MNEKLEEMFIHLAKSALTEIGPVEMHFLGDAIKATFKGEPEEAARLIRLVAESVAAKLAADKLHD